MKLLDGPIISKSETAILLARLLPQIVMLVGLWEDSLIVMLVSVMLQVV